MGEGRAPYLPRESLGFNCEAIQNVFRKGFAVNLLWVEPASLGYGVLKVVF